MRRPIIALILMVVSSLAACGETPTEQALVGGAVGAGTAAVLQGSLLTGVAVGAAGNVLYCQQFPTRC